jgi:hypothetical protein
MPIDRVGRHGAYPVNVRQTIVSRGFAWAEDNLYEFPAVFAMRHNIAALCVSITLHLDRLITIIYHLTSAAWVVTQWRMS